MEMRNGVSPFKDRSLNHGDLVKVYRNLNRPKESGIWYSVMRGRLIVGHARALYLSDARFIVNESGRQRVITSGVKNVHAFVEGKISFHGGMNMWPEESDLAIRIKYNPFAGDSFETDGYLTKMRLYGAIGVCLNQNGVTGCYLIEKK